MRCQLSRYLCVIPVSDEPEVAAAAVADTTSEPPEQPGSSEDSAVTKPPPPPNMKPPLSMDSPSRRATRSKFKLAANFSFTAGLWSFSHMHTKQYWLTNSVTLNTRVDRLHWTHTRTSQTRPLKIIGIVPSSRLLHSSAFFLITQRPSLFSLLACFTISVLFQWRSPSCDFSSCRFSAIL